MQSLKEPRDIAAAILEAGRKLGHSDRFKGQHWTSEFGWMPTSGNSKDERPELNATDDRPSAMWTEDEKDAYLAAHGLLREPGKEAS